MPNCNNVNAPITLVSYGRSGTSLLSDILSRSDEVDFVGETAQLIFSTWRGAEASHGVVRNGQEQSAGQTQEAFCAKAVQSVFLELFRSDRPRWLQKPIGIPEIFWLLSLSNTNLQEWYWSALSHSFENGKFITILRNPIDVAMSAVQYWGFNLVEIVDQLREVAELILSDHSLVKYAVAYDNLITAPEEEVRRLCEFIEIDYHPEMLDSLQTVHVPHDKARLSPDRLQDAISQIVAHPRLDATLDTISRMWQRFGVQPYDFLERSPYSAGLAATPPTGRPDRLRPGEQAAAGQETAEAQQHHCS